MNEALNTIRLRTILTIRILQANISFEPRGDRHQDFPIEPDLYQEAMETAIKCHYHFRTAANLGIGPRQSAWGASPVKPGVPLLLMTHRVSLFISPPSFIGNRHSPRHGRHGRDVFLSRPRIDHKDSLLCAHHPLLDEPIQNRQANRRLRAERNPLYGRRDAHP